MGLDASRNTGFYQQPQQPYQYGQPNTNPGYNVSVGPSSGVNVKPASPNAYSPSAQSNMTTRSAGGAGGAGGTGGDDPALSGAGYQEDFYKQHGQDLLNTPSASEDLYSRGVAGSNPYYDYAQQMATKAINDSSAARGSFNSSYTMNQIGKTTADIRGQQAHELDMLAGQADQGKFGRYDRTNTYANDAQQNLRNRANDAISAYSGLANNQADKVGGFYGEAGRESQQAMMAQIEAKLKASGLTSAEAKQMMNEATDIASLYASLYGAGGMKGGGGGGGSGGGGGGGGGGGDVWSV